MTRLFAGTQFDIPPSCDRCDQLIDDCKCPPESIPIERQSPSSQTAKVRLDKRKHQRLITVVSGLSEPATDLADLLSQLKSACGAGGTIRDDDLEIQGDHLDRVKTTMTKLGYCV
ncbi:translation initiation factor [Planctomycetes bacterium K23_9]|uniref:Translation initiation factor Sui1 n=1 Tax=Stieleria marina TaxID=1930275 RepID=A0A517NYD3_9BACT|nr:translation initiation factor Sui1 [Planctomycetes bacterium K23_9]